MKIEGKNNVVMNLYTNNKTILNNRNNSIKSSDRIEISCKGKEMSKYIEEYKDLELINDKILEIKEKVKQGQYEVNSEKLARVIISDIKRGV
ncbi:MAG: flagellar biosynthesis anti-sigma factor FlgM [Clostridium sp.]